MTSYTDATVRESTVRVGSRVHLRDQDEEEEYTIVRSEDVDFSLGRISMDSPLGRALLGHGVGDRVKVRAPGGLRAVTILDVLD